MTCFGVAVFLLSWDEKLACPGECSAMEQYFDSFLLGGVDWAYIQGHVVVILGDRKSVV